MLPGDSDNPLRHDCPEFAGDAVHRDGGAQLRVTGTRNQGDETLVTSQVARPGGRPVEIDWHLREIGDQLKIRDADVDGVSMRVTQRDEFARVIANNGGQPEALLAVLRQKLAGRQQSGS